MPATTFRASWTCTNRADDDVTCRATPLRMRDCDRATHSYMCVWHLGFATYCSMCGQPGATDMDEPSRGISMAGEWTTQTAPEVVASASGRLWSFVDARELRRVLGQLIAAEVLRMSLAELLDRPATPAVR